MGDTYDVVIIGGGPVGLGLAVELGQAGISVLLVERHATPVRVPKGQNLTQRTMEHFQAWDAEAALRNARTIPREYGIGGLTAYGTLLGEYRYDWLARERVREYYRTDNERLPQYCTEQVLRDRVTALPSVVTALGCTAQAVSQEEGGVRIRYRDSAGTEHVASAQYLVGCDGSRSLIRHEAQITQTRSDHDRTMALIVFRSDGLNQLLQRFPGKSFYNVLTPELEGYWMFLGRVDLDGNWFFHAPVPDSARTEAFDFAEYLHRAVGAEFDVAIEYTGFWDLRFAQADAYRAGRIFLAGDAAHSHPPYGGYGINTGLEDARNLGWKLAAVLHGWGGAHLLDSYHAERHPVFESTARDFIEKSIREDSRFLARYSPAKDQDAFETEWRNRGTDAKAEVESFAPHYAGSPIVFGPDGAVCSAVGAHSFAARPGHHLAPRAMSNGSAAPDIARAGLTLLALDAAGDDVAAFETAANARRVPLAVLHDTFDDGREAYGARLVLVRPDGFVAWAGDRLDTSASAIIARVTGQDGLETTAACAIRC